MKKIIIGILAIIFSFGLFLLIDDYQHKKNVELAEKNLYQAELEQEKAKIEYVKSTLEVYYANFGRYPLKVSDMREVVVEMLGGEQAYKQLEEVMQSLSDFHYEIRGDIQAYKISYKSISGDEIKFEVEYKSKFREFEDES